MERPAPGDIVQQPQRKPTSRIKRYTRETGIDVKYGERTWRPAQTVVDLVQNHLDANTSSYEKEMLRLVGVTSYDPGSQQQQEVLLMLSTIKSSQSYMSI